MKIAHQKTTLTNLGSKVPSYKFEIEASKEEALSVNKNLTEPTGFVVSGYEIDREEKWFVSSGMCYSSGLPHLQLLCNFAKGVGMVGNRGKRILVSAEFPMSYIPGEFLYLEYVLPANGLTEKMAEGKHRRNLLTGNLEVVERCYDRGKFEEFSGKWVNQVWACTFDSRIYL